jgi:NAD kinase
LVIPASAQIRVASIRPGAEDLLVSVDGQQAQTLSPDDRVELARGDAPVILVRFDLEYFARMRASLRWGDLSEREAP